MSVQIAGLKKISEIDPTHEITEKENVVEDVSVKRHCYKLKYRVRWFSSRGTLLVLIWTLLVSIAFGSLDNLFTRFLTIFERKDDNVSYIALLPYLPWFVFALLSGWLADTRFGNHTMVRTGLLILFFASVLTGILILAIGEQHRTYFIVQTVVKCLGFSGRAMILVTSLQLGLDQMPDASAANVTSFIAWFVLCLYAGNWVNSFYSRVAQDCFASSQVSNMQILGLFPIVCLTIVLCSDFLLTPKWFIKELKSPQSSKTIFKVLQFAAKHKAPVQRSALTYWEEDILSRIDLGKSRYGGPFTTEQVENVKTILRMIAVSLPLFLIFTSFYLFQQFVYVKDPDATILSNHTCSVVLVRSFTYDTALWVVIGILIYEYAIYPCTVPIKPTILKRIGATSFLAILLNIASLIVSIIDHYDELTDPADTDWFWILHSLLSAPLKIMLLTSAIEFVSAQSPHIMKGLVIGYIWSEYYLANITANLVAGILHTLCTGPYCSIAYSAVAAATSMTGFILYCILARWYKRRVRDEDYTPHRVVEDVYDRYLHR